MRFAAQVKRAQQAVVHPLLSLPTYPSSPAHQMAQGLPARVLSSHLLLGHLSPPLVLTDSQPITGVEEA